MTFKKIFRNFTAAIFLLIYSFVYSATLESWIIVGPNIINENQQYTVIMGVSNTGITDALNTIADMPFGAVGPLVYIDPPYADIPAGGYAEFTWVYQAPAGVSGPSCITSMARSGSDVSVDITSAGSNCVEAKTNPLLLQDIFVNPSKVDVGQEITVRINVSNTGGSTAVGVSPVMPLIITGTATCFLLSGPSPVTQNVAAGANAWFTLVYQAVATGTLCVEGNAAGYAEYSNVTVTSFLSFGSCVTVQTPASLVCGVNVMPQPANVGQDVTLVMSVTNTGQADALNVCPLPPGETGTGGVSLISSPSCATITGGSSAFFTWIYSAVAPGVVMFTCRAQGTDANTGEEIMSGICVSANVGIASLVISCVPAISPVNVGQNLTVIMNVSNTGSNAATGVVPSLTVMGDAASLSYLSGPNPASAAIASGASQQFTWIYNCIGTGTVSFYEETSGTDPVLGLINAVPVTCGPVIMQTQASLACSLDAYPAQVSIGQTITLVMTVTNSGQAAALTVCWDEPGISGTGWADLFSISLCKTIGGGSEASFTWRYTAMSAGNVIFSSSAHGTDANSSMTVSTGACTSNMIQIQTPADLSCGISALPGNVAVGQHITVNMTVTNTGQAGAVAVAPDPWMLNIYGDATAVLFLVSLPASMNIPGGMSGNFTWIYNTVSTGSLCFSSTAQGTDANSGQAVYSAGCGACLDVLPPGFTPTNTETPTPTATATATATATCVGEGTSNVSPASVVALSSGNTLVFTYTAGTTTWASAPGYGTLRIRIPFASGGWSTPSLVNTDPGYFTVVVNGGTLYSASVDGDEIVVQARDLAANTGQIIVTYGDKSSGGPGANAPGDCPTMLGQFFMLKSSPDSFYLCYLTGINMISFLCYSHTPTPANTLTGTPTFTDTETLAPTSTFTVPETGTPTFTPYATGTPTPTSTVLAGATPCFIMEWGGGGSGDGQLYSPFGIITDSSGNVYVSDTGNSRIQKFDSSGTYITQWGSPGTGPGQFSTVWDIAVDGSGNVFVTDFGNDRVQKFDSTGAYVTQWGGTGSGTGQFNEPCGIAVDIGGNVYVVDCANNNVQKFDNNGVYITQWGSGPPAGIFSGPMGIAIDSAGYVYVADGGHCRILKFSDTGTYIAEWGSYGTGDGQFIKPRGIAVDNAGDIYVVDEYNERVQKFSSTGTYLMQWGGWGTIPGKFNMPFDVAADNSGNIYVADTYNNRVQKFGPCGTPTCSVTMTCTPTPTDTATEGVCVGEGDAVRTPVSVVAGSCGNTVQIIYRSGPTAWADSPGYGTLKITVPPDWSVPDALNPLANGYLDVGVMNGTLQSVTVTGMDIFVQVSGLEALNGFISLIYGSKDSGGTGACSQPVGGVACFNVEMDSAGDSTCPIAVQPCLDVLGGPTVTQTPSYTITVPATQTNTRTPTATPTTVVAAGPAACFVSKWGSAGTGPGEFNSPTGITADGAGNIYVLDSFNDRVQKFTADGVFISQWGTTGSGNGEFNDPRGIAADGSGNIYVADAWNNRIQKFTSTGVYITQWGTAGGGIGQFNYPHGIFVDSSGNVYVGDTGNNRVQKFTSSGAYIIQWGGPGSGNGQFNVVLGMTEDSDGNIQVVDSYNNRIQKFTPAGIYLSQFGSLGTGAGEFNHPYGITAGAGGYIYVTDGTNNRVQVFTSGGVYVTQWGGYGSGDGEFNFPNSIIFNNGYLYVLEEWNNRVQKFGPCASPTPTHSQTPTRTGSATVTLTITSTHTPTQTGSMTATFTVTKTRTATASFTVSPTITATPTITMTPVPGTTLLSLHKTVGGEAPAVGAIIMYELEIRNSGENPAYNIMVWDTLPVQVELYNYSSGLPHVVNGNYILWDLSAEPSASPLLPGASRYILFTCKIVSLSSGQPIANYAGCDYFDGLGKHAPVFSQVVFYPLGVPAIYPNPATDHVKFSNMVPGSQVEIFSLSGEFVNSMPAQDVLIYWDLKNRFNSRVSPGIYYYLVRDAKGKVGYKGKIFIIRAN